MGVSSKLCYPSKVKIIFSDKLVFLHLCFALCRPMEYLNCSDPIDRRDISNTSEKGEQGFGCSKVSTQA